MHGHPLNRELWDEVHQAQTDPDHHIPLDTYSTVSSDMSSLLPDEPETDPIATAGWEQDPNNPIHQFIII